MLAYKKDHGKVLLRKSKLRTSYIIKIEPIMTHFWEQKCLNIRNCNYMYF